MLTHTGEKPDKCTECEYACILTSGAIAWFVDKMWLHNKTAVQAGKQVVSKCEMYDFNYIG